MKGRKLLSVLTVCALTASMTVQSTAAFGAEITSFSVGADGAVKMTVIKSDTSEHGVGIAAVYDTDGRMIDFKMSEQFDGTQESQQLVFGNVLNTKQGNAVKGFLWETDENGALTAVPMSGVYTPDEIAPDNTDEPVMQGYKAVFETDSHVSVMVSDTQDFVDVTENAKEAYARSSDTGEIDISGDGQINFKLMFEDGYAVDSVTIAPKNYKNLKLPSELGENTYRITKVTGDITVTVTSKKLETDGESGDETGDGVIHLLNDSINADGVENVTVNGTTLTITAAGTYTVEGTLTDGQLCVALPSKDDEAVISLNGVSVSSSSADAFSASMGKVTIVPCANTENTFTALADSACGIYGKHGITIKGEGKLNANSALGNGIRCKKDIEIGVCDLSVTAAKNGIKGDRSVKITKKNKSVTVVSGGDGIKSDSAPELITNETTGETVLEGGTVTINGGVIDITANTSTDSDGTVSNGDGIQADMLLTISGGTINITAMGECLKANASSIAYLEDNTAVPIPSEGDGCIVISGGVLTLSAGEDGIKAVKNVTISDSADVTVVKAEEGIQVNEIIYDTDGATVLGNVEGEIDISGGTLDITSSEDGIQCGTGSIIITGGNITVKSEFDGIQAEKVLYIENGMIDIITNGGAQNPPTSDREKDSIVTENSCKGLKAGSLVKITGGTMNISAYDDAVHSNDTVRISGGVLTLASTDDGVHGDNYLYISEDAYIDVTKSYEGIEAAEIYISGGETYVNSTDDGANAAGEKPTAAASDYDRTAEPAAELMAGGWSGGPNFGGEDTSSYGYIEITGGLLYIMANGDGFDSNGDAAISGGIVLVNGPTSGGNGVFDIGDNGNTLTINDNAVVIGAGTSDMAVTPSATGGKAYVVTGGSSSGMGGRPGSSTSGSVSGNAGAVFTLEDSSGNEVITYNPSLSYKWIFIQTPEMMSNTSYTLKTGGTYTGGAVTLGKDGFGIMSGGTYSGGASTTLTSNSR